MASPGYLGRPKAWRRGEPAWPAYPWRAAVSSPAPFNDIKSILDAAGLAVPIAYPNLVFSKPNPPSPWLNVSVVSSVLGIIDMGAGAWREEGTLYADVMVPAGSGSSAARALAKTVANLFRARVGPVVYLDAAISDDAKPDGIWWSISVSVDWRYDDIGV